MNADVPESVLDKLPERLEEELAEQGGAFRLIVAIGQKPTASGA